MCVPLEKVWLRSWLLVYIWKPVCVQCFILSSFALLGMEKEKDPTDKSGGERNKKGNRILKLSKSFLKGLKNFLAYCSYHYINCRGDRHWFSNWDWMLCGIEFLRVYNLRIIARTHDFGFREKKLFANTQDKLLPIFEVWSPELTKNEGWVFSLIRGFSLFFGGSIFLRYPIREC